MSKRINLYVKILQGVYVAIFFAVLASAFTVDILIAPPALAILRVPSNIREIGEIINAPWTQSLGAYHILLLIATVVASINLLGLSSLHSAMWRYACKTSSFIGLLALWSTFLFFLLPFIIEGGYSNAYMRTSIIYAGVTFVILLVDFATFILASQKIELAQKKG